MVGAEPAAAEAEEAKVPLAAGRVVGPLPSSRPSASLAWPRQRAAALGGVALGRRHQPVGAAAAEADHWAVGAVPDLAQAQAAGLLRQHHRHHYLDRPSTSTPASVCVA